MEEKFLNDLKKSLQDIALSEDEEQFLRWISEWDTWTVQQLKAIIEKCRASEN